MAFIQGQDEEELQQPGQAPLVGGGSQAVGGPQGGSGPAGRGGSSGGFVNIQNYLNANAGDTGSAQALNKTVGDQFGQERSKFEGDSAAYLQDAQKQSDEKSIDSNKAQDYLTQATGAYDWNAGKPTEYGSETKQQQNPTYQDLVGKMQGALNSQYSGPREYNYGLTNKTQEYGAGLKDAGGFDSLMRNVYSGTAGRPMSSGQFELQKQLDVGNKGLVDAKDNWAKQYDQLGADRDKVVNDTTSKLSGIEKKYGEDQNALRDFVQNKSTGLDEEIMRQEAAAKSQYGHDYSTGYGGIHHFVQDAGLHNGAEFFSLSDPTQYVYNPDNGQAGYNWEDMQGVLNAAPGSRLNKDVFYMGGASEADWNGLRAVENNYRNLIGGKLNNFYDTQNAKYANTADEQKRGYNAIQDFLGLTDEQKKKQGFNVSGRRG